MTEKQNKYSYSFTPSNPIDQRDIAQYTIKQYESSIKQLDSRIAQLEDVAKKRSEIDHKTCYKWVCPLCEGFIKFYIVKQPSNKYVVVCNNNHVGEHVESVFSTVNAYEIADYKKRYPGIKLCCIERQNVIDFTDSIIESEK